MDPRFMGGGIVHLGDMHYLVVKELALEQAWEPKSLPY
jgi:hypothetical protein